MKNVERAQLGVRFTNGDQLTDYGAIVLQKLADALIEAQDTIAAQAVTIADHEARIAALEP